MLYALLIGVILIPSTILTALILQVYKQDLLKQTTDRTMQTLRAVTYSQEQEIGRLVSFSAAVSMDQDVLTIATLLRSSGNSGRQTYNNDLQKALHKYSSSMSGHVQSIQFYFNSGSVYSYLKDLKKEEGEIRQSSWFINAKKQPDRVQFVGMQSDMLYNVNDDESIVTAIAPSLLQGLHDIELITFVFSRDGFQQSLRQHPDTRSSAFALIARDGSVVGSSGVMASTIPDGVAEKLFETKEGVFTESIEQNNSLVTYTAVEGADWRVLHQMPVKELTGNYDRISRFVLIATVIIIVLSLCIALYFVHRLARPIHMLVVKMSRVMQGNLNTKIEETGTREMVTAGQTFNHMMDEIKRLIVEREMVEKEKRMAEFAALQSQINPHFLINTLNSIRLMAMISKAENIKNMTHALIRLLSSSFNRGGTLTRLSEEIKNLRQYLFIMETRYGNKFKVEWEIDPAAEELYLLKLLLQPIIENSIFHGMSGKYADGLIRIQVARTSRHLLISIEDNGIGMSKARMDEMLEEKGGAAFSGMGIRNVHKRIQLHYGSEYGVSVASNLFGGVSIELTIPVLLYGDEEDLQYKKDQA